MHINIDRGKNKKGKERIRGDCIYMDVKFTFTVHKSSKKEYPFVLDVSLISPTTGHILQKTGKPFNDFKKKIKSKLMALNDAETNSSLSASEAEKIKKERAMWEEKLKRLNTGAPLDELNVHTSAYLQDTSDTTIYEHVDVLVKKLYGNNCDEVCKALSSSSEIGSLHAHSLYNIYQNDFFHTLPSVSAKTLKEKKNALVSFCDALEKPVSNLTDSDIKKAFASLSKTLKKHINTIEKFFEYIGENHAYRGVNPVTRFRQSQKKNDSKHTPPSINHLSAAEDKNLHDLILEQLRDNGMCLAIPLAKGFRMPIDRILNITWKDIIIVGNEVLIQDYREKYTGGTHNYLRPPLQETANFIIARYNYLKEKNTKTQLKNQPLVLIPDKSIKEKKASLSKYFRTLLTSAGVKKRKIDDAINPEDPKSDGGAGYALLCKHYDYVLENICGVELNSGVGYFLRAMRIHDTTTDYYRCLTDETGNHFLQVIMRRDGYAEILIDGAVAKISSVLSEDKSTQTVTVQPENARELTGVLTKQKIFLPAGSDLVVSAENGVRGSARFSSAKESASAEYIKLY